MQNPLLSGLWRSQERERERERNEAFDVSGEM
jgi:hypothetical protein